MAQVAASWRHLAAVGASLAVGMSWPGGGFRRGNVSYVQRNRLGGESGLSSRVGAGMGKWRP
ncbi:Uncharacterised protein [Bordetella pertussis]|nr:Uncharacterised protein [Bordetella pertussis]